MLKELKTDIKAMEKQKSESLWYIEEMMEYSLKWTWGHF